jgi:hypothetical protein
VGCGIVYLLRLRSSTWKAGVLFLLKIKALCGWGGAVEHELVGEIIGCGCVGLWCDGCGGSL